MKPGRELDKLVGEEVLDLTVHQCEEIGPPFYYTRYISEEDGVAFDIPYYSTNISAAFTVDKPGWLWKFMERPDELSVILYPGLDIWTEAYRNYPSIPEKAIVFECEWLDDKARTYAWLRCLAALEAVGMEVGDA